jgi:hypothetical protein
LGLPEQTAKAYHIPSAWEARGSLRRASAMKLNGVVVPLFALRQFCDLCIAAQYPGEANANEWARFHSGVIPCASSF